MLSRNSQLAPLGGLILLVLGALPAALAEEPPALNPFGAVRQEREDAVPGYVEMSDGSIYPGAVYMTRDKRFKIEDKPDSGDVRQREIPLRVVKEIECHVDKEWVEKEWRFKELALDEKYYTGHSYPARIYSHTITLQDGRKLTGPLAEILYVQPYASHEGSLADAQRPEPKRFLIHKRDKGELDTDLKSLLYVKRVKLGQAALEEGQKKAEKAAAKAPSASAGTTKKPTAKPVRAR